MSIENPQTVDEWETYVRSLDRDEIYRKAVAANSMDFVEMLKDEGYGPGDINDILFAFGKKLFDENKFIPGQGATQYLNYRVLLQDHGVDLSDMDVER